MNVIKAHPNTAVGGGLPGSVAAALYLARLFGVDLPDPPLEAGVAIGAAVSALALAVGGNGIRGLASRLWRGRGDAAA